MDIASVEAKHASNREVSLLRSRGWFASLQTLSAKFIGKTLGAALSRARDMFKEAVGVGVAAVDPSPATAEPPPQSQNPHKKPKRGGGGAFRAFCSERGKGKKFDAATLSTLGEQYRNLSPQEREFYTRVGEAASRAHRAGFSSFGNRSTTSRNQRKDLLGQHLNLMDDLSERPLPGDFLASGAIVAGNSDWDLEISTLYRGSGSFQAGYEHVKALAKAERELKLQQQELSKYGKDAVLIYEGSACEDPFVDEISSQTYSMTETSDGFLRGSSNLSSLVSFDWSAPISSAIQEQLLLRALSLSLLY